MDADPDRGRTRGYSWYALGVLFLVYLVNFVDRQILSILANDIKADLALTDAQLGFLYGTAFAIFYALFGIPLGRLADSWSRTRLLALGLSLWSAMTMLSGLARGPAALAAARVGVGVGEATASPCAYSLISDWFSPRMRGTALAIYSAGLFVGSGLSLVIGGMIAGRWNAAWPHGGPLGLVGWQATFIAVGLPGLVLTAWVLSLREPQRPEGRDARPWREFFTQVALILPPFTFIGVWRLGRRAVLANMAVAAIVGLAAWALGRVTGDNAQFAFVAAGIYAVFTWATALRTDDRATFRMTFATPAFVAIVIAYGSVSFLGYTVSYWAAPYAERAFGLSKPELGVWIGAPAALGGFLGVLAGGLVADRLQRKSATGRLWVIAFALSMPVPLILVGYRMADVTIFLVCSFLLQFVTSSALGAAAAASQSLVLPRMKGTATAVFFLGSTLFGLALGPYLAGLVSERSGSLGTGVTWNLGIVPIGLGALVIAFRGFERAERKAIASAA